MHELIISVGFSFFLYKFKYFVVLNENYYFFLCFCIPKLNCIICYVYLEIKRQIAHSTSMLYLKLLRTNKFGPYIVQLDISFKSVGFRLCTFLKCEINVLKRRKVMVKPL